MIAIIAIVILCLGSFFLPRIIFDKTEQNETWSMVYGIGASVLAAGLIILVAKLFVADFTYPSLSIGTWCLIVISICLLGILAIGKIAWKWNWKAIVVIGLIAAILLSIHPIWMRFQSNGQDLPETERTATATDNDDDVPPETLVEGGETFVFDSNLGSYVTTDNAVVQNSGNVPSAGNGGDNATSLWPETEQPGRSGEFNGQFIANWPATQKVINEGPRFGDLIDHFKEDSGLSTALIGEWSKAMETAGQHNTATLVIYVLGGMQITDVDARKEIVDRFPETEKFVDKIEIRRIDPSVWTVYNTFLSSTTGLPTSFVDTKQRVRLGVTPILVNEKGEILLDMNAMAFIAADCRNVFWLVKSPAPTPRVVIAPPAAVDVPAETPQENPGIVTTPPKKTEKTSVTATKRWVDDNWSGRPNSVRFQLYRDGSAYGNAVTLSSSTGWSHTWDNLEKGPNWTVDEVNVPAEYVKSVSGFTITNTRRESPPLKTDNENLEPDGEGHEGDDNDVGNPGTKTDQSLPDNTPQVLGNTQPSQSRDGDGPGGNISHIAPEADGDTNNHSVPVLQSESLKPTTGSSQDTSVGSDPPANSGSVANSANGI